MATISILISLLLAAEILALLPSAYLLLLTLVGLRYKSPRQPGHQPNSRFALLVPAHNEEVALPRLMESLERLEYPRERFDIYVVADNCSDSTAEIARRGGATVFERQDPARKGKGYALQWLLGHLPSEGKEYDAYVFLDADSRVSPNFLAVMDLRLRSGSDVVQSYYTVSNPTQSSVSALRYIALVLMHYVRPKGRQVLGLSCGLFGSGMTFRTSVIQRHGWDALGLAEDVEYYLKLTDEGIKVDFAPEAELWSDMPASLRAARSQNLRWERGRLLMAWKYGGRFLLEGILQRDPVKLDAAIEQLIPPLSITLVATFALLILSLFTARVWLIAPALAANAALMGHLLVGLASARVPWRVYPAFAFAPVFVVWKMWVYLEAMVPKQMSWTRTDRARQ